MKVTMYNSVRNIYIYDVDVKYAKKWEALGFQIQGYNSDKIIAFPKAS